MQASIQYTLKCEAANHHYIKNLLKLTWHSWQGYTENCRSKSLHSASAASWYHRHLLSYCLCLWSAQYHGRKSLGEKWEVACKYYPTSLMRKAFVAWEAYSRIRQDKKYEEQEALHLRRLTILKQGIT